MCVCVLGNHGNGFFFFFLKTRTMDKNKEVQKSIFHVGKLIYFILWFSIIKFTVTFDLFQLEIETELSHIYEERPGVPILPLR